jgi:hypothetical protein
MKAHYLLFLRGPIFYWEELATGQKTSLRTKDSSEAQTLLHSKNDAFRQPRLNLQIARSYLAATDPQIGLRTWHNVKDERAQTETGVTRT